MPTSAWLRLFRLALHPSTKTRSLRRLGLEPLENRCTPDATPVGLQGAPTTNSAPTTGDLAASIQRTYPAAQQTAAVAGALKAVGGNVSRLASNPATRNQVKAAVDDIEQESVDVKQSLLKIKAEMDAWATNEIQAARQRYADNVAQARATLNQELVDLTNQESANPAVAGPISALKHQAVVGEQVLETRFADLVGDEVRPIIYTYVGAGQWIGETVARANANQVLAGAISQQIDQTPLAETAATGTGSVPGVSPGLAAALTELPADLQAALPAIVTGNPALQQAIMQNPGLLSSPGFQEQLRQIAAQKGITLPGATGSANGGQVGTGSQTSSGTSGTDSGLAVAPPGMHKVYVSDDPRLYPGAPRDAGGRYIFVDN